MKAKTQENKDIDLEYTLLGVMHSVDKWLDDEELEHDEVTRAAIMREKTLRIVENLAREKERLQCLLLQFTSTISTWGNKYNIDTSEIPMISILQKETSQAKKELFAEAHEELLTQLESLIQSWAANMTTAQEFHEAYKSLLNDASLTIGKIGQWLLINNAQSYLEPPFGDTCKCSQCGHVIDISETHLTTCPNCRATMMRGIF